jgi:PadR family transcriptional regulator, regulatory protein AphA
MSQKYAVLGLLNAAPMTGYVIKKNYDYTIKKFWPVSYGGLYPALHKLTEEKLIEVHKQKTDGRGKISYMITDEGKQALTEWLLSKTSEIQCKDEYMLKIFLSKDLEDQARNRIMEEYLFKKEEELKSILNLIEMRTSKNAIVTKGSSFIVDYTKEVLIKEIELLKKALASDIL